LDSVFIAAKGLAVEVIVVDNDSEDHTVQQVRTQFPQAKLIVNDDKASFATATNQGLGIARGRCALLLNPDTVVKEDAFVRMMNSDGTDGDGIRVFFEWSPLR
jgi:GT2 family glycosyltransferase